MVNTIQGIKTNIDYGVARASKFLTKLTTGSSTLKKVGNLASKIIEARSLAAGLPEGTTELPKLVQHLEGADAILGIFGVLETLNFWLNPFKIERLDKKDFTLSLQEALSPHIRVRKRRAVALHNKTQSIVKEVISKGKDFDTQKDAVDALRTALKDREYSEEAIEDIVSHVRIAMKPRHITQVLVAISFTVAGVGGFVNKLNDWGALNLGQIASQIGSKAPVLAFVTQVSLKTVTKAAAGIGLTITFLTSAYRLGKVQYKLYYTEDESKIEKYKKERTKALWTLGSTGARLAVMAIPLIVPVSAPVVIGLSIVAEGIGLVSVFAKPS